MCLVVLLTSDVAHQVDASKHTANEADSNLTERESQQRREGEDTPQDWHTVVGHPEYG